VKYIVNLIGVPQHRQALRAMGKAAIVWGRCGNPNELLVVYICPLRTMAAHLLREQGALNAVSQTGGRVPHR
jgi:hypothetical protein